MFVKNLENVQGDERDVILFSVAVAPERQRPRRSPPSHRSTRRAATAGSTSPSPAPARELVVFATLRPEEIDLSRTSARGVRDFKHFLEFAERGARALAEAFAATGREPTRRSRRR